MRAGADATAAEICRQVHRDMPELFPDESWTEVVHASLAAGISRVAEVIVAGTDPRAIELPPETVVFMRDGARQDFPISSLMRVYQLAQGIVWGQLQRDLSKRASSQEELTQAHAMLSAWIFAYVDTAMTLAIEVYEQERERWLRSANARQATMIDAILSGRLADAALARLALRYELDREHIAVAAWLEEADEEADSMLPLEAAISEVAEALGATGTLIQPRGLLAATGWISTPGTFEPELLDGSLLADAAGSGVTLAIGDPGRNIQGFRESYEGAEHARRVAVLQGRPPGSVTRYANAALAALGTADLAQARTFVIARLGRLANQDETSQRLAATLRVYLDEHTSRSRAAKRLGVHENTISYRVRQAEEILGRSVDADTLDLHMALALAPVVQGG